MAGLGRFTRWAALGCVVAGGAAWATERASHDYQLARFRVPTRVSGGHLMNLGESGGREGDGEAKPLLMNPPNPVTPARNATGDGAETRPALRVLHLSDTHLYRGREDLVAWLRRLAEHAGEDFDFVVLTGDMLATSFGDAHLAARAFAPLVDSGIPGAYVFGAHDYHANRLGNPLGYLVKEMAGRGGGRPAAGESCVPKATRACNRVETEIPRDSRRLLARSAAAEEQREESRDFGRVFREFLADSPWINLNNRHAVLSIAGQRVELAGVDDPHVGYDVFPGFPDASSAGGSLVASVTPASRGATGDAGATRSSEPAGNRGVLRIGLAHAPYARILDTFDAAGADLVFCGHTHGGQVCWPGGRALVTNCDLSPSFASGVFSWTEGRPTWDFTPRAMRVSLSPGLGTSPFTPCRVFCPPTAHLVEYGRNE